MSFKRSQTTNNKPSGWNFDNSYSRLPDYLHVRLKPTPVAAPETVLFNQPLARQLGLDDQVLAGDEGAVLFSGNRLPEGADPLAQAYAGHQFGQFTVLGDGRAHLLGEQITPGEQRFDIQLKGSGRTPFSRNGDGRAALGPMLREYLISEAMEGLGIPTTRSLAVVLTGESVYREGPLPGAILTRVAASHIRVGTFQYLAAYKNREGLRLLTAYTLNRHFPDKVEADNPGLALLQAVMAAQASLVARWMLVGFVHGVMNTDNMALCGETIDYGPCAFMDRYDPATVFSSIDHGGRYSYGHQPSITQWNLCRFADTLLPLLNNNEERAVELANDCLKAFPELFRQAWLAGMRAKLGLFNAEEEDEVLIQDLLACLHEAEADYTNTLRDLSLVTTPENPAFQHPGFIAWRGRWQSRQARQKEPIPVSRKLMNAHNPALIARNHRVEEALEAAGQGNYRPVRDLLAALARPFDQCAEHAAYREPPPASFLPYQTFCGT